MSEAKMTSKGQITVPKDVRLKLNLKPGDRLLFIVEDDGARSTARRQQGHIVIDRDPPASEAKGHVGGARRGHRTGGCG